LTPGAETKKHSAQSRVRKKSRPEEEATVAAYLEIILLEQPDQVNECRFPTNSRATETF
jgi:hypothetical protein